MHIQSQNMKLFSVSILLKYVIKQQEGRGVETVKRAKRVNCGIPGIAIDSLMLPTMCRQPMKICLSRVNESQQVYLSSLPSSGREQLGVTNAEQTYHTKPGYRGAKGVKTV